MRVLFSLRHSGALRNFASTIADLASRGHQVHLLFMAKDKREDRRLLMECTALSRGTEAEGESADRSGLSSDAARPAVTYEELWSKRPASHWRELAQRIRSVADYARYGMPEFKAAHALRDRAADRVSPRVRQTLQLPIVRSRVGLTSLLRALRAVERALPPDPFIVDVVRRCAPDVVLVTPLVDLGSDQIEYVKAAQSLGIPAALCVHSWDNLTNKGVIHTLPDRIFVWNDAQRREAVAMHGAASRSVVVTGAPAYDQWFGRGPSRSRDLFCRTVGLPADNPYFLYLCSSQFIAPREADFVKRWVRAIRSAPDADVRRAGVLIRPHPRTNMQRWQRFDVTQFRDVVVWPREATNPVDEQSKDDYFDSMYHSAAAVGINTTAQIETGIVGRRVYSVRVPEYEATQEGTLHFHHLLNESGGLLQMASTLEEHVQALAGALRPAQEDERRLQRFVEGFVRPNGLHVPATGLLVEGIEALAHAGVSRPDRTPGWARGLRMALRPLAARSQRGQRRASRSGVPGDVRADREEARVGEAR